MKAIDPEKKTEVLKYLSQGYSQREAFTKAGIAERTFYQWMDNDSQFKQLVRNAQEDARISKADVRMVEQSLLDVARGFEYEEVRTEYESREVTDEQTGKKEFKPVIKKQVRTQKRVVPNVEAIKFLLTNRDPEHWKNRIESAMTGDVNTNLHIVCKGDPDYQFPSSESELDLERPEKQ